MFCPFISAKLARDNLMKFAKKFSGIGFVIGFVGPLLFYAAPPSFFTFESRFVCPWCPIVDPLFPSFWTWLRMGLVTGLISGVVLTLIGFSLGCAVSKVVRAS